MTETTTRRVRFTIGPLGLIDNPNGVAFQDEVVRAGDEGEYVGRHPTLEGWHLVRVVVGGRTLFCPCHDAQFENAGEAR